MNNFLEKQTFDARNEKNITANELLAEIKLVLPDYFVCDFEYSDGGIVMKFLNGQNFTLKIA